MPQSTKVLLVILDGFGEGKDYPGNAIAKAHTPTLDRLKKNYPWTLLKASGEAVGIPEGTQGGSEVGHFTIGAGRVVFQALEEINRSIKDGSFYKKPALLEACARLKKGDKAALHLLGMISDQGVHAHINHLFALLEVARRENVERIYIHAITDGRDVPEKSAEVFIKQIQDKIKELGLSGKAKIASIIGRYYAMDRDSNWNRLTPAYDLYTQGKGTKENDPCDAIENAFKRGIETDYYIDPIILDEHGIIKDKDSVVFWNFRTDRARELTWAFTGETNKKSNHGNGFSAQKKVRPFFVCMGPYSEVAPVLFPTPLVKNNLGEVVSRNKLAQLRIGETQKYAHVTYFLNSQVEEPFPGEDRIMIDSKKCHTYAEIPEMSAHEITEALAAQLEQKKYSLVAVNFANCDLVGHSGELAPTIKAVEIIDECLGKIIPAALKNGYTTMITGDHGNAEYKVYEKTGEPCPSHTKNPVPFFVVPANGSNTFKLKPGELKDVAPTVLDVLQIEKPAEMSGTNLLI